MKLCKFINTKKKMDREIFKFYSSPQYGGGGMTYFQGMRRHQVGGGLFGSLLRGAIPILKKLGKSVLKIGVNTAHDMVHDSNRKPLNSAAHHLRNEILGETTSQKTSRNPIKRVTKRKIVYNKDILKKTNPKKRRRINHDSSSED